MTPQEVKDLVNQLLPDNVIQDISPEDIRDICTALVDLAGAGDYDSLNIEWDVATTYALDEIVSNLDRLWKSKSAGNIGNQPPSDPNTTEDTYWIEQSKAPASPITEWVAGVYGAGLVIVYYQNNFYLLVNQTRPFNSTNITTEFDNGDWQKLINFIGDKDRYYYAFESIRNSQSDSVLDTIYAGVLDKSVITVTVKFNSILIDGSGAFGGFIQGTFRKPVGSNLIQVGSTIVDTNEDMPNVPSISFTIQGGDNLYFSASADSTSRWIFILEVIVNKV